MGDDQIDWERLDRFVRGEGSPAERVVLERWVDDDPKRRALAEAMRSAGVPTSGDARRFDAARALRRVQGQAAPRRPTKTMRLALMPESRRLGLRWRVMVVTGVAAVMIGGALTWRTAMRQRS